MHRRGRLLARQPASETDGCFNRARGWQGAVNPTLRWRSYRSVTMTGGGRWPEGSGSFTGTIPMRLRRRSARSSRQRFLFIHK